MVIYKILNGNHYHIQKNNDIFESKLINKLISDDFKIVWSNMSVEDFLNSKSAGICIDNEKKSISLSNVSCMACYCSYSNYSPLTCEMFLNNYDEFIKNKNVQLYSKICYSYTVNRIYQNHKIDNKELLKYYSECTKKSEIQLMHCNESYYGSGITLLIDKLSKDNFKFKEIKLLDDFYPLIIFKKDRHLVAYLIEVSMQHRFPYKNNEGFNSPYNDSFINKLICLCGNKMSLYCFTVDFIYKSKKTNWETKTNFLC